MKTEKRANKKFNSQAFVGGNAQEKFNSERRAKAMKDFAVFVDKVAVKRDVLKFNDAGLFTDHEAELLNQAVECGNHLGVRSYIESVRSKVKQLIEENAPVDHLVSQIN